jgi:hypothetical protein
MKTLFFALLCVAAVPCARSQDRQPNPDTFLLYGTFALTHVSSAPNDGGTDAADTSSITSKGAGIGVTFNVHRFSAVALGLDLRLAYVPQGASSVQDTDSGKTNYESLGIKGTFHFHHSRFVPYVEVSAGGLRANAATSSGDNVSSTWSMFEYVGGIDYPLARHLSLRLIEIGGGGGTPTNSADNPKNPSVPEPKTNLFTLNSGLVLCF